MTLFKLLVTLFMTLMIIPVGLATMIYGWGVQPASWGWILFGYLWTIVVTVLSGMVNSK